ncbi:MAG: bifunctional riboflavin kinase/FAD synthetase [Thermodesulfovibrionales bacterium]|nr:bifunctional riboflavin kinase/FAD synthetase [Thermodesulfovibrionales bacterium]
MVEVKGIFSDDEIKDPVITIGNFDGVHIGHQKVFNVLIEKARELQGTPTVMTFYPHPVKVLMPDKDIKMITTLQDRVTLFERNGIKGVIVIEFDKAFASIPAEVFIKDILVGRLGIKGVVVGSNYVFGKGKKGTTDLLKQRGKDFGFKVHIVSSKMVGQNIASSSKIRQLISKGKIKDANEMLGRAYHINGVVIKGTGRGKQLLNIATANLSTQNELVPSDGVYAVKVTLFENGINTYDAVANIGNNPTFSNVQKSYEVHIFDFDTDILGKEVRLHFIKRIRDEMRFKTVDDLRSQILRDVEVAKGMLLKQDYNIFV